MRRIISCRRSIVAVVGIAACLGINLNSGADTSGAIAMICAALAGANAFEQRGKPNVNAAE